MDSYKELPRGRIAIRVATCFITDNKAELRVYEENLMRRLR